MDARHWLVATVAMTACLWMPYVLDRFFRIGLGRSVGNPGPTDAAEQSPWARRARQAHANAVENLVIFAPLVLLAMHLGAGASPLVTGAAATHFFARLAHYLLFAIGVPWLRTVAFMAGFGAQVALLLAVGGLR